VRRGGGGEGLREGEGGGEGVTTGSEGGVVAGTRSGDVNIDKTGRGRGVVVVVRVRRRGAGGGVVAGTRVERSGDVNIVLSCPENKIMRLWVGTPPKRYVTFWDPRPIPAKIPPSETLRNVLGSPRKNPPF